MKIRLCAHNKGAEQFVEINKSLFADINLKIKKCAKQCKTCKKQPFAVIDKQPVLFDSFDELYLYLKSLTS